MRPREYRGKRVFDLLVVAAVAAPAAVIGLACAAAVKLTSAGPVLFRQERIGVGGAPFEVLKFRTMIHIPEGNPIHPDEHRITSAGRWLRRLSLDELPQLVNVIRGEMSIVGPRPTLAYQVERYNPEQRQRLSVRPGITGLAQVRGRNSLAWAERIEIDLEYVRDQSLWLDLSILVRSLFVVFQGGGVAGHASDDPLSVVEGQRPS